jgi:hypothetical protein
MYESFYRTYHTMGHLISELSDQTLKTAAVEAERRAKESDDIATKEKGAWHRDEKAEKLASKDAATKSRQAKKFARKLYVRKGGTARADAVPDYKDDKQKAHMNTAAEKRYPRRKPDGTVTRDTRHATHSKAGTQKASKDPYDTKSAFGAAHYRRLKKRYGDK